MVRIILLLNVCEQHGPYYITVERMWTHGPYYIIVERIWTHGPYYIIVERMWIT